MENLTNTSWFTMEPTIVTTEAPTGTNDTTPIYWGFIAAGVSVLGFGSNFVPVKKFETGDGMFFQWVLCITIWMCGMIVNAVRKFPTFYPLAMLGGFLWSTGNIMVVPIIKTIGLSLGLLIWASFNLLSGWASSRFGWFGFHDLPTNSTLNYAGVALCFSSVLIYFFIKSNTDTQVSGATDDMHDDFDDDPLIPKSTHSIHSKERVAINDPDTPFIDSLSPRLKRALGITLSVISGLLYGVNFAPVIYIYDNNSGKYKGASTNGLDYVFSHFCGILATSTLYFLLYCMLKRNKPNVYPRAILPAVVSGAIWAVADICWFIANSVLSEPISFPIITTGPGIVATLWGVILFKEIRGRRNFLLLGLAFTLTVAGGVLTGLSKT